MDSLKQQSDQLVQTIIWVKGVIMNISSECAIHAKPITNYCLVVNCPCEIRLCEDCCLKHERKFPKVTPLKIETCVDKINIQLEISEKQYSFVKDLPRAGVFDGMTMVDAASEVKIIERLLKKFSEENNKSFEVMNKFNTAHQKTKNTFAHIQQSSQLQYFKKIVDNQLTEFSLKALSRVGQQRLSEKLKIFVKNIKDTEYFINYVKIYGHTVEQFQSFAFDFQFKKGIQKIAASKIETKHKKNSSVISFKVTEENKIQKVDEQKVVRERAHSKDQKISTQLNAPISLDKIDTPRKRVNIFGKK